MPQFAASPHLKPSDIENALYDEWKQSPETSRDKVEKHLIHSINMHAHRVMFLVFHSTSPDIIDDITFSILADIETFQGHSKFSTWVHRAILNYCHKLQRSRHRKKETPLTFAHAKHLGYFDDPDKRLILEQLLGSLTDTDQQILKLYLEGNTVDNMAEILGISWGSAEQRLKRAIRGLREAGTIYQ